MKELLKFDFSRIINYDFQICCFLESDCLFHTYCDEMSFFPQRQPFRFSFHFTAAGVKCPVVAI